MTVPDKTRLTDLLSSTDSGARADTNISFSDFSKILLTNERISVILYHAVSAAMAQLAEHILGKDEVPGPNPGSSSKKSLVERRGILVFQENHQTPSSSLHMCKLAPPSLPWLRRKTYNLRQAKEKWGRFASQIDLSDFTGGGKETSAFEMRSFPPPDTN